MDKYFHSIPLKFLLFIIFLFVPGIFCVDKKYDETLVEKANGRDVVESVLRKITKSNIFQPDNSFLIRLAFTESKFGTESNTYRTDYYGGIWQVDESLFNSTQSNSSNLYPIYTAIYKKFNIKWIEITWKHLLKPLHSGLAAAIYFSILSTPIPDKIDQQADHWIQFYRSTGTKDRFITDSEKLRNITKCRGKMDLMIVLDSSGSIGADHYNITLINVASLIKSFTLDHTRIGMLIYSDSVEVIFPLQNNFSISEMAKLVTKAKYLNSGTNTHLGMLEAVKQFNEIRSIDGVPQIMIVFTDGVSNNKSETLKAVNVTSSAGITTMSVGIGGSISDTELQAIALNDTKRMFRLSDFYALKDFLFTITEVACEVPQIAEIEKPYFDTLIKDEKRLYTLPLPKEGITVYVNVSEGKAVGYWSKTEEVPSQAVHDGIINGTTYIPGDDESQKNNFSAVYTNSTVYISIKGVEEMTNYTFAADIGDTAALRAEATKIVDADKSVGNGFHVVTKCLVTFVVAFCLMI